MLQSCKKRGKNMKIKEDLFQYFEKAGTIVHYHPNDMIYMQEDTSNSLYLIKKGRVRVFLMMQNGDELTFTVLNSGDIFGDSSFFQNSPRPTTVMAINDVELIRCNIDSLYPYLMESKELTITLLQLLSENCDLLSTRLKRAYTYDRYEMVAAFLLELTEEDNIEKGIINQTLPYTHEEFSTYVGLSRVTTTKVLNEFQSKGYVNLDYRKIQILNREGLANILG